MKKALILFSLVISQLITQSALAGLSKFDSDEFNSIIAENQKQEKELRHKLQNEVGVDYKITKTPLKIEHRVAGEAAEEVAVSSGRSIFSNSAERLDEASKSTEKGSMKRLSQELEQAGR